MLKKLYTCLSNIWKFVINLIFIFQIILVAVVFLTATYWFLNLLECDFFSFVEPLAKAVTNLVRFFYHKELLLKGTKVDSTVMLFDFISVFVIFGLSRVRACINDIVLEIGDKIKKENQKIEQDFNNQLKKEAEQEIKKCNRVAILVNFSAKDMFVNASWGGDANEGVAEKEEEAFKIFYNELQDTQHCKFAKSENKILILIDDFQNIDYVLERIYAAVNNIKLSFKKKHWNVFAHIAVEIYKKPEQLNKEVYPMLEKLITVEHENEAICLGSFCARYKLLKNALFTPNLKGTFNISGNRDIWTLVKKN